MQVNDAECNPNKENHIELPDGELIKSRLLLKVPLKNGKNALFSNLTGAIAVVDEELENILELFDNSVKAKAVYGENPVIKKAVEQLFMGGLIVDSKADEFGLLEKTINSIKDRKDYGFMFIMTLKCNFRCVYCYEEHRPIEMIQETAEKCIEFMLQKINESKQKTVSINFYGGEPLLKFDLIKCILETLENRLPEDTKITTSIITNASLLTPDIAQFLKKHNCTFAQITVDGVESIHNKMRPYADGGESFKDVIIGLKAALSYFHRVGLRINVDKTNLDKIPEFLDWLKDNNFQHENLMINFGQIHMVTDQSKCRGEFCISDYSWGNHILTLTKVAKEMGFKASFELPRLLFCGAYNKNSIIFNPDGTLITCWEGAGTKEDFIIGDINKESIYNENARTFWERTPLKFEKCRNCDIISFCGGGCISSAYFENGTFESVSCPYYKENFKELVEMYIQDKLEDEGAHHHVDFSKP